MLTEVHRQRRTIRSCGCRWTCARAANSDVGRYGESEVISRTELDPDRVMRADQVLVGATTPGAPTTCGYGKAAIEDPLPVAGDKLVCLRTTQEGPVQRRAVRVKRGRSRNRRSSPCGCRDEDFGSK